MADDKKKDEEPKEGEAEGGEGAEGGEEGGGKKKKLAGKKLFIIIGIVVFVLIGVGAGLYFSGIIGGHAKTEGEAGAEGEAAHEEPKKEEKKIEHYAYFDLPEIVVNLASMSRKNTFMKISISLQVETEEESKELEKLTPRIVDKFQVYLRGLQVEDLQGSAGIYRLREELLARVNVVTEPVKVHDVLFKEILVQ